MDTLLLLVRLLLAVVLAAAAVGKLADRVGARQAVRSFGVPPQLTALVASALPVVELALASALLIQPTAPWAAVGASVLFMLFAAAMARILVRGEAVDCRCFGSFGATRVGRGTLTRNVILVALAAFVAVAGWGGAGTSVGDVGAGTIVLGCLVGGNAVFSWQLFAQNGRLLARMSALEEAAGEVAPRQGGDVPLAIGAVAPDFALQDLDGQIIGLADLLRPGRGVLLVFSDPECGHCDEVLSGLAQPRGADDVPLAVISRGSADRNRVKTPEHGIDTLLLQDDFEVADEYRVYGLPGAVLVDADGRIARGPVAGARDVARLLNAAASAHLRVHTIGAGSR